VCQVKVAVLHRDAAPVGERRSDDRCSAARPFPPRRRYARAGAGRAARL